MSTNEKEVDIIDQLYEDIDEEPSRKKEEPKKEEKVQEPKAEPKPAKVDDIKQRTAEEFYRAGEGKLKLFVGGLYFQNEEDLAEYFSQYGKIDSCTLIKDKNTGKSRGFAFITIDDPEGKARIGVLSKKHEIKGKFVDVKTAEAEKKRLEIENSSKKVFVGGLEPSVDANDLKRFFEKVGEVKDAIVLRDVSTNVSRGFGFVTFASEEVADIICQKNNFEIKGKKVDIKKAEPKIYETRPRTYPSQNYQMPYPQYYYGGGKDEQMPPYMMYGGGGDKNQYYPPYFPPSNDGKYPEYYYPMPMRQYSPTGKSGNPMKKSKDRSYNPY